MISENTAKHSRTMGAKGPRQNRVQQSVQSPQRRTEENRRKKKGNKNRRNKLKNMY